NDGTLWTIDDVRVEGADTGVPYLFQGRRFDPESGLYYYRTRFYSASLGRFINHDSLGYGAGMNLYSFPGSNPISFVDPFGLFRTKADLDRSIERVNGYRWEGIQAFFGVNMLCAGVAAMATGIVAAGPAAIASGAAIAGRAALSFAARLLANPLGRAAVGFAVGAGINAIDQYLESGRVECWQTVATSGAIGGAFMALGPMLLSSGALYGVGAVAGLGSIASGVNAMQQGNPALGVFRYALGAAAILSPLAGARFGATGGASGSGSLAISLGGIIASPMAITAGAIAGVSGAISVMFSATGGGGGKAPTQQHHIASNKGKYWGPKFADLFKKFGIDINDPRNIMELPSHSGRHTDAYHRTVYGELNAATSKEDFLSRLAGLRSELESNPRMPYRDGQPGTGGD
ncbi:MAG: AHH domain-containing protein, partial [Planctomycetes bacterium]|nr:AHH domain-containing protein [Planctomycetota bacterium]